ncbi:porin [Candidatus Pantoea soli]|uniref:Porin OmpC n=1 Tax=Candidatus Pantoea soli TaxID=3098669 RepID=A0A518XJM0_9GAMM|nr:porin [Pantoea soli]QDY44380.1 porin OmpC [Pantoea soli]
MKIKLIAALVALTSFNSVHAAEIYNKDGNKLDVYGKAVARHYFSQNESVDGDNTYVRFGFKGETQISNELTGYGQWEYNVQANNSEGGSDAQKGNKTRLGFAGLKWGNYGSLDYGRNFGVVFDVASVTDTPVIFDDQTFSNTDNFLTGRGNGFLTYRNRNFFGAVDGLNFALQYQGENSANTNNGADRDIMRSNGDGYGASVSYDIGYDITVLGAYASSKRTDAQNSLFFGEGKRADIWAGGLKYDDGSLYLAATYAQAHNLTPIRSLGYANKSENLELVARYTFENGIVPGVGYFRSKGKDIEVVGDQDLLNYWDFSLSYYFNKNMSVYVDYKLNRVNKDNVLGIAHDDQTGLGLTYQF